MNAVAGLVQDLSYAARRLRKTKLDSAIIVLSLGLGIGANVAALTIVTAVLLRTLDVPDPDSLVAIYNQKIQDPEQYGSNSWPDFDHFREQSTTLKDLAAYARLPFLVRFGSEVEQVAGEIVSPNYFEVLGARPALGRTLETAENTAVVIADSLWRRKFGANPSIPGRAVRIGRQTFTVIGVMPESFRGVVLDWGDSPELWVPLESYRGAVPAFGDLVPERQRGMHWLLMAGRLHPGRSVTEAQAELRTLASGLPVAIGTWTPLVVPLQKARFWIGDRNIVIRFFACLAAIVGLILVIALLNVGNMILARAVAREKEFAMRIALGASRWRILRQLAAEHLLLAGLASLTAVSIAMWTVHLMSAFGPVFAFSIATPPDLRVISSGAFLAAMAAVLMSAAAARPLWRIGVNESLKGTAGGGSPVRFDLRQTLIVGQVALSTVLIVMSGLLVRTLQNARAEDQTRDAGHVLKATLDAASPGHDPEKAAQILGNVLARVREMPGVQSAGMVWNVPLSGIRSSIEVAAHPSETEPSTQVDLNVVSPGYFETIGIPLLQGRDFSRADHASSPDVVMINQRMAQRFWPGENALGRRLRTRDGQDWQVIGIVPDRKLRNFRAAASPSAYRPVFQESRRAMTLQIRTSGNPLMLSGLLQEAVQQVAPNLPLLKIATMQAHLENAVSRERMTAALASALSALAVVLLCVGLYGIVSFHVLRRTREIGVRMALGARREQVLLLILKQGGRLLLLGVCAGVPLSLAAARLASALLYGVSPADGVSLAAGAFILLATGAFATLIPAWRAARIDPASALRSE